MSGRRCGGDEWDEIWEDEMRWQLGRLLGSFRERHVTVRTIAALLQFVDHAGLPKKQARTNQGELIGRTYSSIPPRRRS